MVSVNEFIDAWQNAGSPKEVAEKTGLTLDAVHRRAIRYRRRGIALKRFRLGKDVQPMIERAGRYD